MSHSVIKVSKNLNTILSSGKKRIGFLFGAGTSMNLGEKLCEYNIPGVVEITNEILKSLPEEYNQTILSIKQEFTDKFNIESLLTNINMRIEVVGLGKIDNLDKMQLCCFRKLINDEMIKIFKKHLLIYETMKDHLLPHIKLSHWLMDTNREHPVEIFTTNYDMLIEMALENKKIRFSDGFYGSLHPFFDSSATNETLIDKNVKLWKLHGSLGWIESHNGVVKSSEGISLMILPSILKYRDSRKEPYTYFLDRLSSFIKSDDSVLITSGYSFGDQHINEVIIDALKSCTNSLVIGLFFDRTKDKRYLLDNDLTIKKITSENHRLWILGETSAYINGTYGKYVYNNASKDNLELTSNLFESDYNEDENEIENNHKIITAKLMIVDSLNLFNYLEAMILEKCDDED